MWMSVIYGMQAVITDVITPPAASTVDVIPALTSPPTTEHVMVS